MNKFKFKKVYIIGLIQLILQILLFVFGLNFNYESNDVVSVNLLEILTKVQTTNIFQNFIWCLSNNVSVLFIVFWISYWTFGITGTLWCANSSFMLGALVKLCLTVNSRISVCFILLELLASIIAMLTSTYFRLMCKKLEKQARQKGILISIFIIILVLIIAAILESIALNSI